MKPFIFSILFLLSTASQAAIKDSATAEDNFKLQVMLTKLDGTHVKGTIISYTPETITLLPGTKRERKKGNIYSPETIPYYQIKSIKVIQWNWLLMIVSAGLMFILWLQIKGKLKDPPPSNNLDVVIILSPLLFITAFFRLLQRKKFHLNGDRDKYAYFLSR